MEATSTAGRVSLDGEWALHFFDGERGHKFDTTRKSIPERGKISAVVPGDVHLDLMRCGLLGEPALGLNALGARWVENAVWSHQREFDFDGPGDVPVWVCFEQISGAAKIYLNGTLLGGHANDFVPARFEVAGLLKEKGNLLVVEAESGLLANADRPGHPYAHGIAAAGTKRMWSRKPQSQFGWDWAPRLLNVGLGGHVSLEWSGQRCRISQIVPLVEVSDDLASATVRLRAFVENAGRNPVEVTLRASISSLHIEMRASAEIAPGIGVVEARCEVANPPLWSPRGHGIPHLESLHVEVESAEGLVGTEDLEIGFRRVVVREDFLPEGGRSFVIEVNNRPIFCKGANLVPADLIYCRTDAAKSRALVDRAEELNFNFLRVWGGGVYESDALYREADRRGFLVWQEFIYACSKYPLHELDFHRAALEEARWQVRRLARHPSLVLWCGNNELETASWHWQWDEFGMQCPDHGFFHVTLPKLLAYEDSTRFYWPSSPYSRDFVNPGAEEAGDQHPWGLGFFDTDFRKYGQMVCRFPNEGGVLGPPSLPTLLECLPEGQRHRGSFAWMQHENSVAYWSEPCAVDAQITQWTGVPHENLTLEDYVYWGGLVQGEGLREYCENFRRRMFRSAAAVFWMFNDTWPTVRSWTPVDYRLRRTPCFHAVRRALEPVALVIVEEENQVRVFGINDSLSPVSATLRHGLFLTSGAYSRDAEQMVELPPNSATLLAGFSSEDWKDGASEIAFAVLTDPATGRQLARSRRFRPLPASLLLAEPDVRIRLECGRAIFESSVFVWGVCLDLDGEMRLPDNFFDLFPGQSYSIAWNFPDPPRVLRAGWRRDGA